MPGTFVVEANALMTRLLLNRDYETAIAANLLHPSTTTATAVTNARAAIYRRRNTGQHGFRDLGLHQHSALHGISVVKQPLPIANGYKGPDIDF